MNQIDTFTVVHQQADFVVVSKPCDQSFHMDTPEQQGFFVQLEKQLQTKLWPVHRLDKITSGLIICAKNETAANQFQNLFAAKKIDKTYLAISDRKPKKKQGTISGDMVKTRNGSWKLVHSKESPATTHFFSISLGTGKRLYWLQPQTGKTHQLRVALKSIGAPILGDQRYGGTESDRGYLHAFALAFPWHEQTLKFELTPEQGCYFNQPDFHEQLNELRQKHHC